MRQNTIREKPERRCDGHFSKTAKCPGILHTALYTQEVNVNYTTISIFCDAPDGNKSLK